MKGWMSRFKIIFTLALMTIVLAGCGEPFLSALQPQGESAKEIYDLMILSIIIMTVVFLVVMIIYVYVIFRYRRKKQHEDHIPKQVEGNHALETLWTVIPILLLLILAIPTVQSTFSLVDTSAEVNEEGEDLDQIWVNVTGKQYWWHFEYPDFDITTSQDLYIPTDRKVNISLLSDDVIHSFWVPPLAGKMDVNPTGNRNEMWIDAHEEGVYWGKCAELCGPSHSLMDFKVIAVSPGEFEQWVLDMQQVDPDAVPESATAQEGQELFGANCLACHAIGSSPNKTGPNLTNFADREKLAGVFDFTEENLHEWIQTKGRDMKPGNLMVQAPYDLTDEEADKIIEYLLTLSPSEITPANANDGVYVNSDLSAIFPDEDEQDEEEQDEAEDEEDNEDEE